MTAPDRTSHGEPGGYLLGQPISRRSALRFIAFGAFAVAGIGIEAVRLASMQLLGTAPSRPSLLKTVEQAIPALRGGIVDRAGRALVENVPTWTVKVVPAQLPFDQRAKVVGRLSALLGISAADINIKIDSSSGSRFDPVRIATKVAESTAQLVSEEQMNLPGVNVVAEPQRRYPKGPLFAHLVGYVGAVDPSEAKDLASKGYLPDDVIGRAGVEATHETELRGTYGAQAVQVDQTGAQVQVLGTVREPVAGATLRLTIDTVQQTYAEKALQWGIDTAHLVAGVIAVMNPQTGEVLALCSLPTYDDNLFSGAISSTVYQKLLQTVGRPLINHAISDQYAPGSTYKLVTGTGALADHKITDKTLIDTKAYLSIGPYRYPDWNHAGWGPINIYLGFGHSSDTFFYQLAAMLGIDRLAYWAHQYGFGSPTGIDLPAEVDGTIPTNQWKEDTLGEPIFPGEVYHAGIGQGYDEVTPIQMVNAYCTLANGGRVYRPQIVRDVFAANGNLVRPFKPDLAHHVDAPAEVFRIMRNAARRVVTIRHTYNLVDMPIKVAGKTGTAEFGVRDKLGRLPYHDWGVFFVPKDPYNGTFDEPDSELCVLAFANDSRTIGNTSTEIVKYYFQMHFGIKHDYRLPQLLQRGNFYGD